MLASPHVLLRVFTVFRCRATGSHLRRPNSLMLVEPPLQALKNAPKGQRFSHPPPPHPSHSYRVRAGKPKKPSAFRGEAPATHTNTSTGNDPTLFVVCVPILLSRSAEGFSGRRPLAREAVRGVRRRPGNERCRQARCLALAKRSSPAQRSAAGRIRRGCERGPDGVAPEKPGVAHAAKPGMGVAPRLILEVTDINHHAFLLEACIGVAPR